MLNYDLNLMPLAETVIQLITCFLNILQFCTWYISRNLLRSRILRVSLVKQ